MGEPQNIDDIMNMIAELDSNIVALIARLDSAEARAAAAERERDELRAAQQWQPIETAPKDGTDILVSVTMSMGDGEWETTQWVDWQVPDETWPIYRQRIDIPHPPTHWQPLPAPPQPR